MDTTNFPKKYGKSKILNCPRLSSFFYIKDTESLLNKIKEGGKYPLFLDSGAFSAYTKGKIISLEEYSSFVKENNDYLYAYSNLDVIGDSKATRNNQKALEKLGINPIPVFHYNENEKYLIKYLKEGYKHIALGGLVMTSKKHFKDWLDKIWGKYLVNTNIKIHGFAVTSHSLLTRFPWHSVDSTTWIFAASMGEICYPLKRKGEYKYDLPPLRVGVTVDSLNGNSLFKSFSKHQTNEILKYVEYYNFPMGKSVRSKVSTDYKLKVNERWIKRGKEIEIIEERGLSNDYMLRRYLNAIYFMQLQKYLTNNTPVFKPKTKFF